MALVSPNDRVDASGKIKPLMAKFGGICRYCKVPVETSVIRAEQHRLATREHLVPKARGGNGDASNIGLSCATCNSAKGDMTDAEFMWLLERGELHPAYIKWLTQQAIKPLRGRLKMNWTRP